MSRPVQPLRERDVDVLRALARPNNAGYWVAPERVGGTRNSHHAATLRKLERRGYALRNPVFKYKRLYKITDAGRDVLRHSRG